MVTRVERAVLRGGVAKGNDMRAHEWTTPLGPVPSWRWSSRTLVRVMPSAKQPIFVVWGPDLTMLYDDGSVDLLGSKDPEALGAPFFRALDQRERGFWMHCDTSIAIQPSQDSLSA